MILEMGKRTLAAFCATVGVMVLCGLVLGWVEGRATGLLYALLGWGGIVATGLVGTPVHELGHFLMCKLFGFRVTQVALFRPIAGRTDGVLGFVRYTYDPSSPWQRLGCFFVGVAPMGLGVLAILLVLRLLTPEVWRTLRARLDQTAGKGPMGWIGGACSGLAAGLFQLRGWGILRGVICLCLVLSISLHMTLSPADLRGAAPGVLAVAALCFAFGVVTTLLGWDPYPALRRAAGTLALFFGVGVAFALMTLLLLVLLRAVFP